MGRKNSSAAKASEHNDYLSREAGGWKKKWKGKLPVALIYPNTYPVGMSNLGYQLVYGLLNEHPDIVAERIFLTDGDKRPVSVESCRPLLDFPILLCSISFEHDYLQLLKLLDLGGLPPLAADRARTGFNFSGSSQKPPGTGPLVIAGGVATFINPEPLAPFIDLFIIGEAEPILPQVMEFLRSKTGPVDRNTLLRELAVKYQGCYVPELYEETYNDDGTLSPTTASSGLPKRIKKITLSSLQDKAGHSLVMSPDAEFANLYMTELGRGCSRGCRFCAAGFVYRPPRLWSADTIISALNERLPGSKRVGLLGMEMARREDLVSIADYLLKDSCSLSFSSLRADVITPELLDLLGQSGLKSAAIAPDGGSERLRKVINKNITEKDLLTAAGALVNAGVMNLKLYFMIGLPTETDDDILEMVELTRRIKKKILKIGQQKKKLATLTLSVNNFIPKPWTPFQYESFTPISLLKKRIKLLRSKLAGESNIKITVDSPEKAYFQAVLARGDRKVGRVLLQIARSGKNWRQVFKQEGIKPEDYAMRKREQFEVFPWEIIDHGIDRQYLWAEYKKALIGKATGPCDTEICKRCGVCNDQ